MKPQLDDVEHKAASLGFSLKKGTKPGAGYNLKHDATGEMPLGSDFRASLTEVDRYLEKRLLDMAQAFGLNVKKAKRPQKLDDLTDNEARAAQQSYSGNQLQRKEFFGYEVFNPKKRINTGEEVVLGQDHDASFEDVARYLQNLASDAGDDADVEIDGGESRPRVVPPKPAAMREAAKGHVDEAEIADLVKHVGKEFGAKPKVTLDERRRGMALVDMLSTVRVGIDRLSPEIRARFKAAEQEEERIAAASTPKTKRRVSDGKKITIDDYAFEERRRQNNAFKKADRLFTRTNIRSRLDGPDLSLQPRSAVLEEMRLRRLDRREDRDFLPPEADATPAPKASTGFAIEAKRGRVSRNEIAQQQRLTALAVTIRAELAKPPKARDKVLLGRLFEKARPALQHGDWQSWIDREFQITDRTVGGTWMQSGTHNPGEKRKIAFDIDCEPFQCLTENGTLEPWILQCQVEKTSKKIESFSLG